MGAVGYGDMTPLSAEGRLVAQAAQSLPIHLAILEVADIAVPVGKDDLALAMHGAVDERAAVAATVLEEEFLVLNGLAAAEEQCRCD